MNSFRFTLSGWLVAAPLLGLAQATVPAPTPRYYVGLALYSSAYQPLGGGGYRPTTVPVQVTAGYQLRPRLAVQLGVAYSGASSSYSTDRQYFPNPGSPSAYYEYNSHSSVHKASVALLARYRLARQLSHRLQADLLGGLTLEANRYSFSSVESDSSRSPVTDNYDTKGTAPLAYLLTAGPSVRCRLGRHLEAVLDFTLNYNLRRGSYYATTGLTGATALGLRYRFGKR